MQFRPWIRFVKTIYTEFLEQLRNGACKGASVNNAAVAGVHNPGHRGGVHHFLTSAFWMISDLFCPGGLAGRTGFGPNYRYSGVA